MPKVTLKRVLEALTPNTTHLSNSVSGNCSGGNKEPNFSANLTSTQFQLCKTIRHGFPHQPTALAYDPVQKLLAIGCFTGSIRILGQAGVDCYITHENNCAVVQLVFLANQGALVSVCADDTIHLWNLRQKKPAILHTLKFKKECITCCHLPHQCSWIYIGTKKGNTHFCNVEKFTVSGYAINWNKAIDLSQKTHPGHVVTIAENPIDESKALICFSSGLATLWDFKNKVAEHKYHCISGIRYACWHFEGKQFMCCHDNGSLTTWNIRSDARPQLETFPHAKREGDSCFPINKVQWFSSRNSLALVVFSGGLSRSMNVRPTVTVMKGRSLSVLEVAHPIVDFVGMISTPWTCDFEEPNALAVLTDRDLVVVDLESPGYPSIDPGHVLDIHDSPVTCLKHVSDPNTDLIPGLYKISKPHHEENCKKEWPISGGECGSSECDGVPEIFITGHADGSVRFWDASAVSLKALYKLRTKKIFKRDAECSIEEDDPLQITHILLCPESRTLVIANSSSAIASFKLDSQESQSDITTLDIPLVNEFVSAEVNDPEGHNSSLHPHHSHHHHNHHHHHNEHKELSTQHSAEQEVNETTTTDSSLHPTLNKQDSRLSNHGTSQYRPLLKVKSGDLKQGLGFHVGFVCFLLGSDLDSAPIMTHIAMNTSYQLLAIGSTNSLCVVDMVQKTILLNMSTDAILTSIDKRVHPRSPNRPKAGFGESSQSSFSFDQTASKLPSDTFCDSIGSHSQHPSTSSMNHKTAQREPSVSSTSGVVTGAPRLKKHASRVYKKTGSCSFERSMDSTTSADDSVFSRASSMQQASFESERSTTSEVPTYLVFSQTYTKKSNTSPSPCLWVGTSGGYLFNVTLNIPSKCEERSAQFIVVAPSGSLFHVKSGVVYCAFLDSSGHMISAGAGNWREHCSASHSSSPQAESPETNKERNQAVVDKHFMVVCCENHAKVFSLPSQTCMHSLSFNTEMGSIVQATVDSTSNGTFLACYSTAGYFSVYNLPGLNMLMKTAYFTPNDERIINTFSFLSGVRAIYCASPSEIQRITYSVDVYESIQDIVGHLFIPRVSPERPSPGFFKGLFGGGYTSVDREELFGRSGVGSRAFAEHIPGTGGSSLEGLRGSSSGLGADMQRLRMQTQERGEKLSELQDASQRMQDSAMKFSSDAHALAQKFKNKKWYQL